MNGAGRRYFTRRVAWGWIIGTLVVVAIVAIWGAVTQQGAARAIGPVIALLLAGAVLLLARRGPSYLEGTVLVQVRPLGSRRADLARATEVSLRPASGQAQLVVRDAAGGSAFETLLLLTGYVRNAQPPALLDAIAAALAGAPGPGGAGVRRVLGAQAAHLRQGGSPETSPLRVVTSRALYRSPEGLELRRMLESPD